MRACYLLALLVSLGCSPAISPARVHKQAGHDFMRKREYDKAIAEYGIAIELGPDDADAYACRGDAWMNTQEYDKAIADYDQAIRLNPRDAMVYNNYGIAWYKKRELRKAEGDFNTALRLDPEHAPAYFNRGNIWRDCGDYDRAVADYSEAIRLRPDYAPAHSSRGTCRYRTSDYREAIADFNEALRLNARLPGAWNGLAMIFATCPSADMRNGSRAVEAATRACELTGWEDWRMLRTLAAAHAEAGDFDQAIQYGKQALSLAPDEGQAEIRRQLENYSAGTPTRME